MTAPTRARARRGDGEKLRGELLAAAKDLLAETGDEAQVTVRAVAQRVGVSVPSVYLHFPDKQALIDAVCEAVFDDIGDAMDEAAADATGPMDALRRRGIAYCDFGLRHPEHYRVMFMRPPRGDEADVEHSQEEMLATECFGNLIEAIRACQADGVIGAGDPMRLALGLWAAAHGITSLLIAKPGFPWPDAAELFDHVIDMAGIGTAAMSQGLTPPS